MSQNPTLHDLSGLKQIWTQPGATDQYYPLVFSTFWIEHHIWGDKPAGYHVVNVLLHALGAILFWRLLRRLTVPGAWFAALLFAVHPVHVESVAWITERKNTLSLVFYLTAFGAYLRFIESEARRKWHWYVAAILLFAAALLSKTTSVTLPAALFIVLWWKRPALKWNYVLHLMPMVAMALAAGAMTWWVETHDVGTQRNDWSMSWIDRFIVASRSIWLYLGKLLWPGSLMFTYPRWPTGAIDWRGVISVALCAVLAFALWSGRQRTGKGVLAAILFFLISLAPVLGFIDIYSFRYSFVADHFQYLPSLGILGLVGACGAIAWRSVRGIPSHLAFGAAVTGIVVMLMVATHRQCEMYRDEETLWATTIKRNPAAWNARINLGFIHETQGRLAEAKAVYESALAWGPRTFEAHLHLANVLARSGDVTGAEAHYKEAIAIDRGLTDALFNYGLLLLATGRFSEAAEEFEAVLRLDPSDRSAHFNLGEARAGLKQHEAAIVHFRAAVNLKPEAAHLHRRLAQAYVANAEKGSAIAEYRRTLELSPGDQIAAEELARLSGQTEPNGP